MTPAPASSRWCEKDIAGEICFLPPNHPGRCLPTCGDCKEWRCHWGSEDHRRRAYESGERCGCARHKDSRTAAELWARYDAIPIRRVPAAEGDTGHADSPNTTTPARCRTNP